MTETPTIVAPRRVVVGAARDVERVMQDINQAINAFNWSDPRMFIYQHQLHWVDIGSGNGAGPRLREMTANLFRGVCATHFQCVTPARPVAGTAEEDNTEPDEDGIAGPSFSRAKPMPPDVAGMMIETSTYWQGIPHLNGVVALPYFRADGTLCDTEGYDANSHVYYAKPFGFDLPRPVPEAPSQAAIAWARQWLLGELFVNFPFASQADLANTVAILLSPFVVYMTDCPLPLFVLTADNPGVGKSLLAEVIGRVHSGGSVDKAPWPKAEEEFEKKIFSVLAGGSTSPLVIWDNVPEGTAVDSPVLAALHTSREYAGRTLGKSEWRRYRNDKVWAVTGNALGTGGDMARRSVYCALAAQGPHPEDRPSEQFRHPRLRQFIDQNRAMLVLACLTLIQGWQAAGAPLPPTSVPRMGDYAPWVETIGGVLETAEIPGFLGNVHERREASDTGVDEAGALFEVIAQHFPNQTFRCADLAAVLRTLPSTVVEGMSFPTIIDKHLTNNLYAMENKGLSAAIGRWFTQYVGRWQGDQPARRIVVNAERSHMKYYLLETR